jgi:RNA polymerase sigma factor (sigma-70 family)
VYNIITTPLILKDKDIIEAIKAGNNKDRKALEEVYRFMLPRIRKLINTGTEKEENAKDVLQEALLVFYKHVLTNKFDEQYEIAGFIYRVAKNLWLNQLKKDQRFVELKPETIENIKDTNILDQIGTKERKELVQKLFDQLDEKCKELITYSLYEELSMKEVAEKTGHTSANAATVAMHRCKKYLMDQVKKYKISYHS